MNLGWVRKRYFSSPTEFNIFTEGETSCFSYKANYILGTNQVHSFNGLIIINQWNRTYGLIQFMLLFIMG
jgi:hypothetical protein